MHVFARFTHSYTYTLSLLHLFVIQHLYPQPLICMVLKQYIEPLNYMNKIYI